MMNIFRATTDVGNSQPRRSTMNRRATLMLVVGGVAGIAAPSARADADIRKKGDGRGTSAATSDRARGTRDMKIGSAPQFQNLKEVGPERQVVAIRYQQDTYKVTTADVRSTAFW